MVNGMGLMDPAMMQDLMGAGFMMMHSVLLARVIGIVIIIAALGVLLNKAYFQEMMEEVSRGKQQMLVFVTGFVTLVFGVLMVMAHNIWVSNWSVIVTLFSWLVLIKGAVLVVLPKATLGIARSYKTMPWMASVAGLVFLVIGLVFLYFGYMTPVAMPVM